MDIFEDEFILTIPRANWKAFTDFTKYLIQSNEDFAEDLKPVLGTNQVLVQVRNFKKILLYLPGYYVTYGAVNSQGGRLLQPIFASGANNSIKLLYIMSRLLDYEGGDIQELDIQFLRTLVSETKRLAPGTIPNYHRLSVLDRINPVDVTDFRAYWNFVFGHDESTNKWTVSRCVIS